jgi:hypothetical protein
VASGGDGGQTDPDQFTDGYQYPDGIAGERHRGEGVGPKSAPDPEGVGDIEQDLEERGTDSGQRQTKDGRTKRPVDDTGLGRCGERR